MTHFQFDLLSVGIILCRVNVREALQDPGWVMRLLPFALFTAVPILWFRRFLHKAVLPAESSDAAPICYATGRFLASASVALWLLWTGAVLLFQPWLHMGHALYLGPVLKSFLHNGLTLLAPSLILTILDVMAYDVTCALRGLEISRREHFIDSLLARSWLTLPVTFVGTGIWLGTSTPTPPVKVVLIFVSSGFFLLIVIQLGWLRRKLKSQFTPHSVSFGALRDRAFTLAEVAKVKLNEIYIFPMSRWRLANAYASDEKNLLITDWLLRHLNVREVDAVIGHELAHIKRGHAGIQGLLFAVLLAGPMFWFQSHKKVPDFTNLAFIFLLCWYSIVVVTRLISRRHERQADLEGIRITKDPEAFITGLIRLDRLNMTPLEFNALDQTVVTHPSTHKRIMAVAAAANLSPETIHELLARSSEPASGEQYELPPIVEAATAGESPIFNSALKQKMVLRYTFIYVAALGGLPVLFLYGLSRWPDPSSHWAAGLGAAVLSIGFVLLVQDCAVGKFQSRLGPRLRARLFNDPQGAPVDPIFVGLSPHGGPRTYEGCHNWDLGFLEIQPEFLRYTGEQCQFTLARSQIRSISLGNGPPKWLKTSRIYIEWSDSNGAVAQFSLCSSTSRSLWNNSRRNLGLFTRLESWLRGNVPDTRPEPSLGGVSRLPPSTEVTSKSPYDFARSGQFILSSGLIAFLAFMISSMTLGEHSPLAPRFYTAAWAAGLHAFGTIPAWRAGRTKNKRTPGMKVQSIDFC